MQYSMGLNSINRNGCLFFFLYSITISIGYNMRGEGNFCINSAEGEGEPSHPLPTHITRNKGELDEERWRENYFHEYINKSMSAFGEQRS